MVAKGGPGPLGLNKREAWGRSYRAAAQPHHPKGPADGAPEFALRPESRKHLPEPLRLPAWWDPLRRARAQAKSPHFQSPPEQAGWEQPIHPTPTLLSALGLALVAAGTPGLCGYHGDHAPGAAAPPQERAGQNCKAGERQGRWSWVIKMEMITSLCSQGGVRVFSVFCTFPVICTIFVL